MKSLPPILRQILEEDHVELDFQTINRNYHSHSPRYEMFKQDEHLIHGISCPSCIYEGVFMKVFMKPHNKDLGVSSHNVSPHETLVAISTHRSRFAPRNWPRMNLMGSLGWSGGPHSMRMSNEQ